MVRKGEDVETENEVSPPSLILTALSHSLALLPIFCVLSKDSLCIYKHICVSAHT